MKFSLSQVYVEPGVNLPFSHRFSSWMDFKLEQNFTPDQAHLPLPKELSTATVDMRSRVDSPTRKTKYFFRGSTAESIRLISINLSCQKAINGPLVLGPKVYKKTKEHEYTIFLPFEKVVGSEDPTYTSLSLLLESIAHIMCNYNYYIKNIESAKLEWIKEIKENEDMFKHQWPQRD